MSDHPIQGLMTTAMESLKEMIDVNTIIGDPVETPDGSVILTVSKVGFGFAAGGSEFVLEGSGSSSEGKSQHPFGGGSGGGVSITPIAFLIVSPKGVKMLHLDENTHLFDKLLDFAPQAVDKIQQMMSKKSDSQKSGEQDGNKGGQKKDDQKAQEKGQDKDQNKDKEKDDKEKNKDKSKDSGSMKLDFEF